MTTHDAYLISYSDFNPAPSTITSKKCRGHNLLIIRAITAQLHPPTKLTLMLRHHLVPGLIVIQAHLSDPR